MRVDPYRRSLERAYVAILATKVAPPAPAAMPPGRRRRPGGASVDSVAGSDVPAIARGELIALDAQVRAALPRAADRDTRLQLLDIRALIDRALHPGRSAVAAAPGSD